MIRMLALGLIFCGAASQTLAAPRCIEPYAPQIPDGAKATKEEMAALRSDAQAFIAASDIYQDCLLKRAASGADSLVDANQRMKEQVGREFRSALAAYNAKNAGQLKVSSR